MRANSDEWKLVKRLLPVGWKQAAHRLGAFRRSRQLASPSALLRVLLFHSVNTQGLRESALELRVAGVAQLSHVALFKRLRSSSLWLAWLARGLCSSLRRSSRLPSGFSWRLLDSTTLQQPHSPGTSFRLHYSLDLLTLSCDWHQLTEAGAAEALSRLPLRQRDVVVADRNFLTPRGLRAAQDAGAFVLIRLRWTHPKMWNRRGQPTHALSLVRSLRVGQVGHWNVWLRDDQRHRVPGRLVAVKLPLPLARKAQRRMRQIAQKKQHRVDRRTLQAARYVMVFTTLPAEVLSAEQVLEAYRFRWQVELAFKRLKRLLKLGQVPHRDKRAARAWIEAKLVVALLLERLYREARDFSPWGYELGGRSR